MHRFHLTEDELEDMQKITTMVEKLTPAQARYLMGEEGDRLKSVAGGISLRLGLHRALHM